MIESEPQHGGGPDGDNADRVAASLGLRVGLPELEVIRLIGYPEGIRRVSRLGGTRWIWKYALIDDQVCGLTVVIESGVVTGLSVSKDPGPPDQGRSSE